MRRFLTLSSDSSNDPPEKYDCRGIPGSSRLETNIPAFRLWDVWSLKETKRVCVCNTFSYLCAMYYSFFLIDSFWLMLILAFCFKVMWIIWLVFYCFLNDDKNWYIPPVTRSNLGTVSIDRGATSWTILRFDKFCCISPVTRPNLVMVSLDSGVSFRRLFVE